MLFPPFVLLQAVAVAGYMAFGNTIPPNVLTGFSNPSWLIDLANVMLILHMLPAYQLYLQPLVAFIEDHFNAWEKAPAWLRVCGMAILFYLRSLYLHALSTIMISTTPQGLTFRISLRSTLVVLIGFVGILMPFFNDIVGLVGAVGFWPATVYFPIECWIRMYKPQPTLRFWLRVSLVVGLAFILMNSRAWKNYVFAQAQMPIGPLPLQFLNIGCAVVSLAATVGSVYSIVADASSYKIFAS